MTNSSFCYQKLRNFRVFTYCNITSSCTQILRFWTLSIVLSLSKTQPCLFFKTQRFGDWIMSPEIGTSSIDWTQLSRFYLKTETESSLRNVAF
jgi:hypothetical protein